MAARIFIKAVPYAMDDVDPKERFITSNSEQFFDHSSNVKTRGSNRKPVDFQGRPLPYALDDDLAEAPNRYITTSIEAFVPRDLTVARPAKLANFDFVGRPLPYARDDGVDELSPALKPKKKENRFTQGRPIPYALDDKDDPSSMYSTTSKRDLVERDLRIARPARRVTHDQPYDIVTLTDRPIWKDLAWTGRKS